MNQVIEIIKSYLGVSKKSNSSKEINHISKDTDTAKVSKSQKNHVQKNANVKTSIKQEFESSEYPLIRLNTNINELKIEIVTNRNNKGVSEDFFLDYCKVGINNKFRNDIKIIIQNKAIFPDIVLIKDDDNSLNGLIIEIDEPYTLNKSNHFIPTHYDNIDKEREELLLKYGWNIIRFSEEQIFRFPSECINVILSIIDVESSHNLKSVKRWTKLESLDMIKNEFRNTYLPKEFTNIRSISSGYSYRNLPIRNCIPNRRTGDVIINIATKIEGKNIDIDGLRQCYIKEDEFIRLLKNSNIYDYFKSKNIKLNEVLNFLGRPIFKGIYIQGFGIKKAKYFNLSKFDEPKVYASDYFFKFMDNYFEEMKKS